MTVSFVTAFIACPTPRPSKPLSTPARQDHCDDDLKLCDGPYCLPNTPPQRTIVPFCWLKSFGDDRKLRDDIIACPAARPSKRLSTPARQDHSDEDPKLCDGPYCLPNTPPQKTIVPFCWLKAFGNDRKAS